MTTLPPQADPLLAALDATRRHLDARIDAWRTAYVASGRTIFCGAGCGGCCTLFVRSTVSEALAVARTLPPAQRTALRDYVDRQRDALRGVADLRRLLRIQRRTVGPCPFLDAAGSCTVYPQRPLACRALLSTRPAEWCSVDFSELTPLDRQAYLGSLDRSVVAFPVHYAAPPQEYAAACEEETQHRFGRRYGFTLAGSFPLLVHLQLACDLAAGLDRGAAALRRTLEESGYFHPLLLQLEPFG